MKRALAMLLAFCLIFGQLPAAVFATEPEPIPDEIVEHNEEPEVTVSSMAPPVDEEADTVAATSGTCGENLTWTLSDDGVLTISGEGPMDDYEWNGAPWYDNRSSITSVLIDNGVTTIGAYAFYDCDSLISVEIPDTVSAIGKGAFSHCNSLAGICVDENNLKYYSDNYGVLYDKQKTTLIQAPGAISGSYSVPDSVTSIGNDAFSSCYSLTSVEIPDSVTTIGDYAFDYCISLTSVAIPDSVTTIDSWAFSCCTSLTAVEIGDSVISIGHNAFYNCTSLTSVTIPNSVTSIGSDAFYHCESLTRVTIGDSVTTIDCYAFGECTCLSRITFTGDAPSIEYDAFGYISATAYYPMNNPTWTSDVLQDYGGTITWVGLGDLVGIDIVATPAGGIVGEEPNLSGLVAELVYSNDIRLPVDVAELTISEIDTSTPGRKTVTVSYGDFSAEFIYGVHAGREDRVLDPATYPESTHNYANSLDETQVFTYTGASSLTLLFSNETCTESGWDFIYVYDGSDNQIAVYTGTEAAGVTLEVPGDTVKIKLTSDGSVNNYGYSFDSITAESLIHTGTETTSGVDATCTEPGRTGAFICEICGVESFDEIPALGHDYEAVVTEPTPENYGYTTHTCTRCGDSYTDNFVMYDTVANGECGDNVQWFLRESGTLIILGEGEMRQYSYSDNTPWYGYRNQIVAIEICDGVTSISEGAFSGCKYLTIVKIPDSVTFIGDSAFSSCDSLSSLTIGNGVTSIGNSAFYRCYSLKELAIPDSVITIDSFAFEQCNGLTSVTIGNGVTTIGYGAFEDCDGLISLTIGSGVLSIDSYAFGYCDSLTSVTIPDSVTTIGRQAFVSCLSLTSVTIGSGVTTIGQMAFGNCGSLVGFSVAEDNLDFSSDSNGVLFNKEKTELIQAPGAISGTYAIPDGVITIGIYALAYCDNLTGVTIPDSVTTIESNAFYSCDRLICVAIGSGVTTIDYNAFGYCDSLTSVTIPDSVTTIDSSAFDYCDSLNGIWVDENNPNYSSDDHGVLFNKEMTQLIRAPGGISGSYSIPDGVVTIASQAFEYCDRPVSITIPDSVTAIGEHAFYFFTGLTSVSIPDSVTTIGRSAFSYCENLTEVSIGNGVTSIGDYAFEYCEKLAHVAISDCVTTIGNYAFSSCVALTSVDMGNGVTSIGESVFYNCSSLTSVIIPDSITRISSFMFGNCDSLTDVTIPDSVTAIGEGAFYFCKSLTSVTIPNSVTSIEGFAFQYCSLERVTIPASVTTVDSGAFYSCTDLEKIKFCGDAPYIANNAFGNVTATAYYPADNKTWTPDVLQSYDGNITWIEVGELLALEVESAPVGCVVGETPVFTNLNVMLVYPDGVRIPVDVEDLTVSPIDTSTVGQKTVKVSYEEVSAEFVYGVHNGVPGRLLDPSTYPESEHNYPYGVDETQSLTWPGADGLVLVFSEETQTQNGYDYIFVYDDSDNLIAQYTGNDASGVTLEVPGDTVKIRLTSFGNNTAYGYSFTSISSRGEMVHEYTGTASDVEASCISAGKTDGRICDICDHTEYAHTIPAPGHDYTCVFTPATENSGAYFTYTCTVCGDIYVENYNVSFEGRCDELSWSIENDTLYLANGLVPDFTNPAFDQEHKAPWYSYQNYFTEIDIPYDDYYNTSRITEIGDYAFYDMDNLTYVVVESVSRIGSGAFAECDNLTGIEISLNCDEIAENAFAGTDNLTIYGYIGSYAHFYAKEHGINFEMINSSGTLGVLNWTVTEDGVLTLSGNGSITYSKLNRYPWSGHRYGITSVVIEEGVVGICAEVFDDYSRLSTVTISSSVTSFDDRAIIDCHNLTGIYVDENNPQYSSDEYGVLFDKDKTTLRFAPKRISGHYQILDSVTTIYESAFSSCNDLTNVDIGSCVTSIGSNAFASCGKLGEIRFLGDAPRIERSAFDNVVATVYYPSDNGSWTAGVMRNYGGTITWVPYSSATEVATGYSGNTNWVLTSDGVLTFSGSGNMKNYGYSGGQPWLGKGVDITSVVFEEGIVAVGSGAFRNLTTLKSVKLPETLTKMGEAAFYGTGLTSVEIPAALYTIQPYTFKNCENLTSVIFHEGNLQKISDGAFYGTGLTELVLPDCLDILDVYAFKGCTNLASITIGNSLTELREAVFYGTAISEITIPEGITKIGPYAFKLCTKLETIQLPESMTSIGEASFYDCAALASIELPDAVTSIGNYAFRRCVGLTSVIFGENLATIGESSFYGCTGLTELVIPDKVTTIKPYAFKTCTGLTSVTLGSKVATIGEGAFNTCTGLKTIVFPDSLTTIGDYCFSGSWNLWKLTFEGDAPTIGTGAFKGMAATAYYPSGNLSWTSDIMQNYGGKITWKAN